MAFYLLCKVPRKTNAIKPGYFDGTLLKKEGR